MTMMTIIIQYGAVDEGFPPVYDVSDLVVSGTSSTDMVVTGKSSIKSDCNLSFISADSSSCVSSSQANIVAFMVNVLVISSSSLSDNIQSF